MERRLVYCTCSTQVEAERIGKCIVAERLAACVNILPGMRSIYWWEDRVDEGNETVLIAKTTADRVETLTARILQMHSYQTPCVVAVPIVGGNAAFLDWITEETKPVEQPVRRSDNGG